jgi:hypothetical protein
MKGNGHRPPAGQPFVWLTREILRSDAWRSLGINGRRFIDFLLIEHMAKGGDTTASSRHPAISFTPSESANIRSAGPSGRRRIPALSRATAVGCASRPPTH